MCKIDLREVVEDRTSFMERVYCELVKTGYRRDRGDIAYIPVNDTLELQFKLNIEDLIADSKLCVFNDHLTRQRIAVEELKDLALKNTQKLFPSLFEKLYEILGLPFVDDVPMYVLTNSKKLFGACAVLYSGIQEEIERSIGKFIVIPSSVHEVIIIPEYLSDPGIVDIIREVNTTVVDEKDQLSDVPYRFAEDGKLVEMDFAK